MTGTVAIILMVVVWLFVLAPMLLRGQRPIRRTSQAFDETRVVYEGGSGEIPEKRRARGAMPKRPSAARAAEAEAEAQAAADLETVDPDDILIEDRPSGSKRGLFSKLGTSTTAERAAAPREQDDHSGEVIEGDVVPELTAPAGKAVPVSEVDETNDAIDDVPSYLAEGSTQARDDDAVVAVPVSHVAACEATMGEFEAQPAESPNPSAEVAERARPAEAAGVEPADGADAFTPRNEVEYDDSYVTPADYLHPDAEYGQYPTGSAVAVREHTDQAPEEATQEDLEFAAKRRGRGGYDPQADAVNSVTRYQRRQRTLIGLGAFVLVGLVLGFVLGSGWWIVPVVALALTGMYLYFLRQQVRSEQRLRARRLRQLRRARMGVSNTHDAELGIPHRLRRPGAVVLEVDDESPDFEYLGAADASEYFDDYEDCTPEYAQGSGDYRSAADERGAGVATAAKYGDRYPSEFTPEPRRAS